MLLALVLVAAALAFGLLATLTATLALPSRSARPNLPAERLEIVWTTRTSGTAKSLRLALAAVLVVVVAIALLELIGSPRTSGTARPAKSFRLALVAATAIV